MKSPRIVLVAVAAVSLLALTALAADPSGTWKWSVNGPDGNQFETTLKLDFKDGRLTGTYSNQFGDSTISQATFKDTAIAFEVDRDYDGNKFVIKYQGVLKGDTIKGTIELPGMGGGEPNKLDWNATRAK